MPKRNAALGKSRRKPEPSKKKLPDDLSAVADLADVAVTAIVASDGIVDQMMAAEGKMLCLIDKGQTPFAFTRVWTMPERSKLAFQQFSRELFEFLTEKEGDDSNADLAQLPDPNDGWVH